MSLNLMNQNKTSKISKISKISKKCQRKLTAWNTTTLEEILGLHDLSAQSGSTLA